MEVFINGTQKTDGLSVGNGSHPNLPSGYLTVRHGKIHHAMKFGKPSISIRAMALPWLCYINNQMVKWMTGGTPTITPYEPWSILTKNG